MVSLPRGVIRRTRVTGDSTHSRFEAFTHEIISAAPAGNCYVNRSMPEAVPAFGGKGHSGTTPKAGDPHPLLPFSNARGPSINIAAQVGESRLLNL